MKFLILEDSLERIELFRSNFKNVEKIFVDNPKDAIEWLQKEKFDALFLDHDLGGQTYVPSGDGTGYEVAKWLEANPKYQPRSIYLHSLNSSGVQNMKAALPNALIAPLVWMQQLDFDNVENK